MATPLYSIGGVPLIDQAFSWMLTPGPQPYIRQFITRKGSLNDRLKALENPTYLELAVDHGTGKTLTRKTIRFEKVYLLQPKEIDDFTVAWQLADTRFSWRGMKLYFSYNKTREQNLKGVFAPPLGKNTPAELRRPFDRFSTGRYVDWSVKDNGQAYNIAEIIELQLKELGISTANIDTDNSYIQENLEMSGVPLYSGLAQLLAMGRHNLSVDKNGNAYVYSLDFFDENQVNLLGTVAGYNKISPATLYLQDMKRIRPKIITVRFEQLEEVRLVGSTTEEDALTKPSDKLPLASIPVPLQSQIITRDDVTERRAIGCQNVIQVPIELPGQTFQLGQYVPMWEYLNFVGISVDDVREFFLAQTLPIVVLKNMSTKFGIAISNQFTNYAYQIANRIKQDFRQLWQIDPNLVDQIKSIQTRRVAVIDNYSRFAAPSPVWMDYVTVVNQRLAGIAKGIYSFAEHNRNWVVDDEDPLRSKPTPHSLQVINRDLGLVRVTTTQDIYGVISEIIPSAVDKLPIMRRRQPDTINYWQDARLREQHTFEALVGIIWNTDLAGVFNSPLKFYDVDVDFSNLGGVGPKIEYLSSWDTARFASRQVNGNIEGDSINSSISVALPINQDILEAIAASEAARLINQLRDRVAGKVELAGIVDGQLMGTMNYIEYSFTKSDGLKTVFNFMDAPPDPRIEQTIDSKSLAYLKRQIPRANRANAIGDVS